MSLVLIITIRIGVHISDRYVVLEKRLAEKLKLPKNKAHCIIGMGYDDEIFRPIDHINLFEKKGDEIIFTYI